MIDFKTYLIKERIIDYYTIYPFEDITQIPDFYMAKKSGLIEDVRIETCGINGGDIKQLPLMRQHLTGKFYISVDVFNAHWKKLKIGLEDADRHVRINLLRKLGRVAIFNSDEISFESCGDLETMEYIERKHRNRIFDNRALLYIYSDASYTVHDKSCKLVDKIPDEYIQGSEEMPENYIFCKSCKHRLMLRKLIGQDTKNLELYEKFLNRGKVDRKYLELLYQAKKAALYLENPYALRITYNNDAWKVKSNLEGELVELLHNSYIYTENEERYMTGDYHIQKGDFTDVNEAFKHILTYSEEQHMIDDESLSHLLNRNEKKAVFEVYRAVEIKNYIRLGLTHELLKCGYGRRKTAQKLLLEAAKIDCSKQEIDEKIGSKELSKEITAGMIAFTNRILSKNNYPAENISRRILIQLGIQEEVKKLISSNNKFLAAYLTRDTENGRKGYTPNVIGYVYNAIHDNADYSVLALEDLKYVVKMGCDEQLNEIEGQEMIKAGIKIITDKAYKPIEYGPFVSAYMAQRKAISYVQMLKYLKNLNDDRKKFDEVYSNLQHEEQKE